MCAFIFIVCCTRVSLTHKCHSLDLVAFLSLSIASLAVSFDEASTVQLYCFFLVIKLNEWHANVDRNPYFSQVVVNYGRTPFSNWFFNVSFGIHGISSIDYKALFKLVL